MSRALAEADRRPLDFYATPDALALAICQRIAANYCPSLRFVVEPSAGRGAFVRAIRATWAKCWITAVDIDGDRRSDLELSPASLVYVQDWPSLVDGMIATDRPPPDLIIGNPPYRQAQEHIEAALEWLNPGGVLAFLLRINFLGSTSRLDLWARGHFRALIPVVPRPSFTQGGTDGTEYAVFVFVKGFHATPSIGRPLAWKALAGVSGAGPDGGGGR